GINPRGGAEVDHALTVGMEVEIRKNVVDGQRRLVTIAHIRAAQRLQHVARVRVNGPTHRRALRGKQRLIDVAQCIEMTPQRRLQMLVDVLLLITLRQLPRQLRAIGGVKMAFLVDHYGAKGRAIRRLSDETRIRFHDVENERAGVLEFFWHGAAEARVKGNAPGFNVWAGSWP